MKVAIVGDSFTDNYLFGTVSRISPEAPIPILDLENVQARGGGALNVANNLYGLGISPTLFTITDQTAPYEIVSPKNCVPLVKNRYIGNNYQLLRVDVPKHYLHKDLIVMSYPEKKDYDIIAFVDYNKGTILGGEATIVDTKKKNLLGFKGSKILKINGTEYDNTENAQIFKEAYITRSELGIDYYKKGKLQFNVPAEAKEVIDVSGAGDTVMAIIIYCLASGISDPKEIMRLANKGAGIVISKQGTVAITKEELYA